MMTIEEKVQHWLKMADRDVASAEYNINGKFNLNGGYFCHQAVEKALKARFVKLTDDTPPYTHDLLKLAKLTELYEMMSDEQKGFIKRLDPLQIRARYQEYKDHIEKELTDEASQEILTETKEMLSWIKSKM